MKVPRGKTIRELMDEVPRLRLEDKATDRQRATARESSRKRCPYLFNRKKRS